MQPHDCVHPVGHGPRKPETSGAIGVCGHKAEVDELKKLYDSMDVVKEVLDENRVKNANVRLAYWQTRRADAEKGIFKGKKPTQPVSDRLREIRDRIAQGQSEQAAKRGVARTSTHNRDIVVALSIAPPLSITETGSATSIVY